MRNPMQKNYFRARFRMALCGLLFLLSLGALASGCSFIFDFQECETTQECTAFDDAEAKEFFVCSNANKCVLEVERECRQDADCPEAAGLICAVESGKCVAE